MCWTQCLPEWKRFQRALEKVDWTSLSQMFWQWVPVMMSDIGLWKCSSAIFFFMLYRGKFISPRVAERRLRRPMTSATGTHSSARYCGAKPCENLNTSRHSLNVLRCGTSSQCVEIASGHRRINVLVRICWRIKFVFWNFTIRYGRLTCAQKLMR